RRRHTRFKCDWSSDVCSSDLNESEGAYNSLVRGRVVRLRMRDERRVRMSTTSSKFALEGPQTLTSPMPGKVVKVLVEVGREVEEIGRASCRERVEISGGGVGG